MDFDPIGIFLATLCTGGEKLLFRFPNEPDENHSKPNIVLSSHSYALKMPLVPQYSVCRESELTHIRNGVVVGFEDFLLANLLISSKSSTSKRRYEVKVGDVIFVGFLHEMSRNTKFEQKQRSEKITFNVVFALQAGISNYFIPLYQDLSEKISLALIHEEDRTAFMSRQKQTIIDLHESTPSFSDKVNDKSIQTNVHDKISTDCSLGVFLRSVYESICELGNVDLFLNDWVRICFTISPKVPRNISCSCNGSKKRPLLFLKPSLLQECIREMRPYHSFILLQDKRVILEMLTIDCSPVLRRLLKLYTPLKSIDQLAAELDVALTQVRQVICCLVVWGFAMLIYPIYDSNIYLVAPNADLNVNSPLNLNFAIRFPDLILPKVLEAFSSPFTFGHHRQNLGSTKEAGQESKVLIWLLQHKLIYQLHTYPYLDPFFSKKENSYVHHMTDIEEGNNFVFCHTMSDVMMSSFNSTGSDGNDSMEDISSELNEKQDVNSTEEEQFCRLACNYFNGMYHLEAIMYRENITRNQLCHLIDRFRDRIYVIKHEEPFISYWVSSE